MKRLVGMMSLVEAKTLARRVGQRVRELWSQDRVEEGKSATNQKVRLGLSDQGMEVQYLTLNLASVTLRVSQEVAMLGVKPRRYALSKCDTERLTSW